MTFIDIVDLSSGDELVEFDVKPAKLKSNLVGSIMQQEENNKARLSTSQTSTTKCGRQEFDENRSPNAWSTGHSSSSMLDQAHSPVDDIGLSSSSPICQAPICRQFWKAGNYDGGLSSKVTLQSIVLSMLVMYLRCSYWILCEFVIYVVGSFFISLIFWDK